MLYRKIQKSGDSLSILGFGCMRLPQKKGSPGDGRIDEDRATKQIRMAIDHGIDYIDTALPYHMGTCEPFLGRSLSNEYREKVKLATKLPHWMIKEKEEMDVLPMLDFHFMAAMMILRISLIPIIGTSVKFNITILTNKTRQGRKD